MIEQIEKILSYGNDIFVNGTLITVLILGALLIGGKMVKKIVRKAMKKKLDNAGREMVTTYSFAAKIIIFVINLIIITIMFLQIKGFQKVGTAMIGASGILAVVLGLAAQESMSNIIGGFFLSYYRPFNVGDLIYIADRNLTGIVLEIGLRHTEIKTFNNSRITIPNSIMNNSVLENKDKDIAAFRNFLYFDISYGSNIDQAIEIIQRNCENHQSCLDVRTVEEKNAKAPVVPVLVTKLKDFSVELRASVVSEDAITGFAMCCDLRKSIKETFDKEGVKIPFPTHTIVTAEK